MEVIIRASPDEIAAFVRATQERQADEELASMDVIKEAVRRSMRDTGPAEP